MKRGRAVAVLAAASVTACGLVLGIDDLPLRPEVTDAGDSGADAGCTPSPRTGCACATYDFCDDFDNEPLDSSVFSKWESGLPTEPFVRGQSTMTVVSGGLSPPQAAESNVFGDTGKSAYAAIFEQMEKPPGKSVAGIRMRFSVKIGELNVLPGGGPVADAATAYVGALIKLIGFTPPQPGGAAVLFGMDGAVYLALSPNILESNNADVAVQIYDKGGVGIAKGNWTPIELVVTTKAKAIELGYVECNDVDAGALPDGGETGVAAAWFFANQFRGCLPLSAEFNGTAWTANPILGIGSGVFNGGTLKIQHDNIIAEFL